MMASLFSRGKAWLLSVLLAICFLAWACLVQVNGDSMVPSLSEKQIALVVRQTKIERFDVVVVKEQPKQPSKRVVKRIIGLPGDELSYQEDQLFINNQPVSEPFLDEIKKALEKDSLLTENIDKIKIPENSYFILGDNRRISLDSRINGAVHENQIIGEVKFVLWPPRWVR